MTTLNPNSERMQAILDAFAAPDVGGTPGGGVSRPAASDADRAARDKFAAIASDFGLRVRVDDVGNMYARREGIDADAAPVLIGSHLDTVVPGGRFDGILGVAVALETVALLQELEIVTQRPIEVVNWMGEEGARFPPAMLGSGVVAGAWDAEFVHSRVDAEGISLADELERIGYLGERSNRIGDFFAALEMHIEQGTVLQDARVDVGIVSAIEPVRWISVTVAGKGGHAGGPGPADRHEALVAAARMIVTARDSSVRSGAIKATVGRIEADPGSYNVIPHQVAFTLDLRSVDDATLDAHNEDLEREFAAIAAEEGVDVSLERYWAMSSPPFDTNLTKRLSLVAERLGVSWRSLTGRIGHDSVHLAAVGPVAMVFTQTEDGRSHCEDELAPWPSVLESARVFANTVVEVANSHSLDVRTAPGGEEEVSRT